MKHPGANRDLVGLVLALDLISFFSRTSLSTLSLEPMYLMYKDQPKRRVIL
uniref:Putative inactive receptor kinase At2g26730 n=1 Tax=Rhizophora mucronata TaxID=61149 RepID=A0A2P2JD00_RHIMU